MKQIRLILLLCLSNISLNAATYTVSNGNDAGNGSLREAIMSANASAGLDNILFSFLMLALLIW